MCTKLSLKLIWDTVNSWSQLHRDVWTVNSVPINLKVSLLQEWFIHISMHVSGTVDSVLIKEVSLSISAVLNEIFYSRHTHR